MKLLFLFISLFACMTCSCQTVASYDVLSNKTWVWKEPRNSGVISKLYFNEKEIRQTIDCTSLGKTFKKTNCYYLSDEIPDAFDSSKVGNTKKGHFIIWMGKKDFVCMEILKVTSDELQIIRVLKPGQQVIGGLEPVLFVRE